MSIALRVGRFVGPWLVFAALSGLGDAIIFAAPVFALAFIPQTFHEFFQNLCWMVIVGFSTAFLFGLNTALVGGNLGCWWSFFACFLAAFSASLHRPPDPSGIILFFCFNVAGCWIPFRFLGPEDMKSERANNLRLWMRETWLVKPPFASRLGAVFLCLLLCFITTCVATYDEYLKYPNYVARYGPRDTWARSWNTLKRYNYGNPRECQSNLRQIMVAVRQYSEDYDGVLPPTPKRPSEGPGAVLLPYVSSSSVFQCPSEFYFYTAGNPASGDFTDYWFNARCYGLSEATLSPHSDESIVVFGEGNTGKGEANAAYSLSRWPANFSAVERHRDSANIAFLDGHVRRSEFSQDFEAGLKQESDLNPAL